MRRTLLQALALIPLPLLAGLVWHSFQHNRHAGPRFLESAAEMGGGRSAAQGKSGPTLPAAPAPGWRLEGSPVRYDHRSLFDRIDGAAPVFIRAGFVSSLGGEYRKGKKEPVSYDVYDMGSGRQALGMYALERDPSYSFVAVGDEGYLASGSLNFWRGRYYVKLAGQEQGEAMDRDLLELGRGIAAALPPAPEVKRELEILRRLPAGQLPHSLGFSRTALGDVTGLEETYYADYREGEHRYRQFVVQESSAAAAADRWNKAKDHFEREKAGVEERRQGEARLLVARSESSVSLIVQAGALLAGALDLPEAGLLARVQPALLRSLGLAPAGTAP